MFFFYRESIEMPLTDAQKGALYNRLPHIKRVPKSIWLDIIERLGMPREDVINLRKAGAGDIPSPPQLQKPPSEQQAVFTVVYDDLTNYRYICSHFSYPNVAIQRNTTSYELPEGIRLGGKKTTLTTCKDASIIVRIFDGFDPTENDDGFHIEVPESQSITITYAAGRALNNESSFRVWDDLRYSSETGWQRTFYPMDDTIWPPSRSEQSYWLEISRDVLLQYANQYMKSLAPAMYQFIMNAISSMKINNEFAVDWGADGIPAAQRKIKKKTRAHKK